MAKRNETPDERLARHQAVIAQVRAENPTLRIARLHELELAAVAESGMGYLAVEDSSLAADTPFVPSTGAVPGPSADDIAAALFKRMKADQAIPPAPAAQPPPPAPTAPTTPAAPAAS